MTTTESDRPIGGKSPKPWVSEALAVLTSRTFVFLAGWAASFLIVFIRNPDAYLNPVFLTEDGRDYVAGIYRVGFWQALFGARGDYLVFGNVFLTWLGVRAFDLLGHGRFADLPRYLALISYAYFAAVIALPLYVFRGRLRLPYLAALWLLTAFVPLGISDNEILGRLSNIGFACAYAGLLLAWFRTCGEGPRLTFALADLGILFCAATNPIVLALAPIVAGVAAFRLLRREAVASPATLVALAFGCVLIVRYAACGPVVVPKASPLDFAPAVEVGVARNILFPFIYPFYSSLGTATSCLLCLLGLVGVVSTGRRQNLGVYAMGGYFLAVTSLVLVIKRPELATYLGGYRSTRPDRYFFAHNWIALALAVFASADLASRTRFPRLVRWLPALFLPFFASGLPHQSSYGLPGLAFVSRGDFGRSLREAIDDRRVVDADGSPNPNGEHLRILSYPEEAQWDVVLPLGTLRADLQATPTGREILARAGLGPVENEGPTATAKANADRSQY